MMKTILFSLIALLSPLTIAAPITSPGDPALAGATVITFSEQSAGTSTSFTFGDVTFTADASNNLTLQNNPCASLCTPDTGHVLGNQTSGTSGGNVLVNFNTAVSAFGFGAAAQNSAVSVSAFDQLNALIEVFNFSGSCCSFEFGGIAASDIYSLLIATSDYIIIDNFTYTTATEVSEPNTIAVLSLGLIALITARRKKPKQLFSK